MFIEVITSDVKDLKNNLIYAIGRIEEHGKIDTVSVTQTQENGVVTLVMLFNYAEK